MQSIMILFWFLLFGVPVFNSATNERVKDSNNPIPEENKTLLNNNVTVQCVEKTSTIFESIVADEKNSRQRRSANIRKEARRQCLSGLITVQHKGRFGNLFMEYATVLGYAKRLNEALPHKKHVVALSTADWKNLTDVFDGVKQKTIARVIAKRRVRIKAQEEEKACKIFLPKPDSVVKEVTKDWEKAFYEPKLAVDQGSFVLEMAEGLTPAIASVAEELRRNLRFKKPLLQKAQTKLRLMADYVKRMGPQQVHSKVVLVGMHARRTDLEWVTVNNFKPTQPANETYFTDALRWMVWSLRTRAPVYETLRVKRLPLQFASLNKTLDSFVATEVNPPPPQVLPTSPLIAVPIISDDMPWVKENLIPALQSYIKDEKVTGVQVFGAGSHDPMVDLALLSQCNHTIISYGTFGSAGAILSGGRTVVYNMSISIHIAGTLAKFFPSWVLM